MGDARTVRVSEVLMGRAVGVLGWVPVGIDVNRSCPARVHDYYLGGYYNFPADRWAAEHAAGLVPDLPATVRAHRAFLQRAVRLLVDRGVSQFLDLGSGIPTSGHVHAAARAANPTATVVYVDHDPVAVAHGTALLADVDGAAIVQADLRDVPLVLAAAPVRQLIDFSRPVGVVMVAVLQLLADADDPAGIVAHYGDAVPRGSHLVLSHPTADRTGAYAPPPPRVAPLTGAGADIARRTRDEIAAMFDGWDLLRPGVTEIGRWRSNNDTEDSASHGVTDLGGVARKP